MGSLLARLRQEFKKGFGETVAEVMDAEVEGENEIHPCKKVTGGRTSSHRISILTLLKFSGQVQILFVVASVFDNCKVIQRAAVP